MISKLLSKASIFSSVSLLGTGIVVSLQSPMHNDTKRKFYEESQDVEELTPGLPEVSNNTNNARAHNDASGSPLISSVGPLESFFKSAREHTNEFYIKAHNYLYRGYERYDYKEKEVTGILSSLHDKQEDLFPNSIYIVIAALSGNIIARQRGILSKFLLPPTLGLIAYKYFLPHTCSNTFNLFWNFEERKFPTVADQQKKSYHTAKSWLQGLSESSSNGYNKVTNHLNSWKKKFAEATGLNVDGDISKK